MGCGLDWSSVVRCQQVNTAPLERERDEGAHQGEDVSRGCNWPVVQRVMLT